MLHRNKGVTRHMGKMPRGRCEFCLRNCISNRLYAKQPAQWPAALHLPTGIIEPAAMCRGLRSRWCRLAHARRSTRDPSSSARPPGSGFESTNDGARQVQPKTCSRRVRGRERVWTWSTSDSLLLIRFSGGFHLNPPCGLLVHPRFCSAANIRDVGRSLDRRHSQALAPGHELRELIVIAGLCRAAAGIDSVGFLSCNQSLGGIARRPSRSPPR